MSSVVLWLRPCHFWVEWKDWFTGLTVNSLPLLYIFLWYLPFLKQHIIVDLLFNLQFTVIPISSSSADLLNQFSPIWQLQDWFFLSRCKLHVSPIPSDLFTSFSRSFWFLILFCSWACSPEFCEFNKNILVKKMNNIKHTPAEHSIFPSHLSWFQLG